MRRVSWENVQYVGPVTSSTEINPEDLQWLCGCGLTKAFEGSKAYPICSCGRRMRMLDYARLGYARGVAS